MLVTIATTENALEAHILRGRLQQDGIPVFVAHEHFIWIDWMLSNAIGGAKVQVPISQAKEALELLRHTADPPDEDDHSSKCPACNGRAEFDSSLSRRLSLLITLITNLPIPFVRSAQRCRRCLLWWSSPESNAYRVGTIVGTWLLLSALLMFFVLGNHAACVAAKGELGCNATARVQFHR